MPNTSASEPRTIHGIETDKTVVELYYMIADFFGEQLHRLLFCSSEVIIFPVDDEDQPSSAPNKPPIILEVPTQHGKVLS